MTLLAEFIGESPGVLGVREKLGRLLHRQSASRRVAPLLIQGETGTGKGLLAHAIHAAGPRSTGPFVDVNCAAIPETLLEAELFGFERGAFTDAHHPKPGLFQAAHYGTIFLDEVGLLPDGLQVKLLKVIEERAVRRLGSTRSESVDVWVLSATSQELFAATRERRFREDLYHRLAVVTVSLPPLRQRGRDILLLADHFLARFCADYGLAPKAFAPDARDALLAYSWPGNIRELANAIERVALLSEAPLVTAGLLELPEAPATKPSEPGQGGMAPLEEAIGTLERARVLEALRENQWNISRTAARLGISRNALRYRIEKHRLRPGMSPPGGRRASQPPRGESVAPGVPGATFAPPVIRWQHRHLTLLRATLIRPPGADIPPDASRALEVLVEKVRSFGGQLEGVSPTGVMAIFGLEPAEDAPSRSALSAMAIQKAAADARRGFAVKVSIHMGRFMVGRVDALVEVDLEARRDALTVLESLIERSEPNTIVVSAPAAPFLQRRFELVPVSAGGSGPAQAYRLVDQQRTGFRPGGRVARFIGRNDEMEVLRSRLTAAAREQGQVVGIMGEAGIGKSRLLFEFRQGLGGKRLTYLEGRCLSYGTAIPYLPVLDLLRSYCAIDETDTAEAIAEKIRSGLRDAGMDADEASPYLLQLLGVKDETEQLGALNAQAIKARTFEAVRQLCLKGSRRQLFIIVVEDLQWIDRTSEEFLASLVETLAGAGILLLTSYRPGYRPPWIEKSYATQLTLDPLSPPDSRHVMHSVLGAREVPAPVSQAILDRAQGNPFFLEELAWAVRKHGRVEVPDTVQGVLNARIDRLPEGPKRLLQAASVLGRDVSLRLLRAIWTEPGDLEPHLRDLTSLEFLYPRAEAEELTYVFKHVLTQEVAYEGLLPPDREVLHAAVGRTLEALYTDRLEEVCATLAHHYSKTRDPEKAVEYLSRSAEKAARAYAHVEAVAAVQEALVHVERLPADQRDRRLVPLILRQAHSLYFLGRLRESLNLLVQHQEHLGRLDDAALAGRYHFVLAQAYSLLGQHEQAVKTARRAIQEAERCSDNSTMGKAYNVLTLLSFMAGEPAQGVEHGRHGVALLEPTGERYWLGSVLFHLTLNHVLNGDFEMALANGARVQSIGEAIGDPRLQSYGAWTTGWVHALTGECDAGIEACKRAVAISPDPLNTAYASGFMGHAHLQSGNLADAIPLLEEAARQLDQFRFGLMQGWFTAWLSEALLLHGRIEKAEDLAIKALELTREAKFPLGVGLAQRALGRIAWARGATPAAADYLRESCQTFAAIPAPFELGRTYLTSAELANADEDRETATSHVREAYNLFKRLRVPQYEARATELANKLGLPLERV